MLKNFTLILLLILCTIAAPAWSQIKSGPTGSEEKVKVVKLYPNPATSKVNFEIQDNNGKGYELIVFNMLGKKMDHFKNLNPKNEVQLDNYYGGIYIFQLRDKVTGGLIESGKFNVVK
ncbi:T9SS type A sorting domain-containing protein [Chitinophaga sedimenti]|uniref:T9SS type A sorting domain-containing protein n=1 Tax=Chitinophaga sedimenti TaxID=2033606 RepID=UPI002006B09B|nr:T9SS type A sorting domain-containing protein [Chitinophaga sedimenti]MCK7559728.1 T9SS type A sorting domain-containing protein [Chitinophaga sedimenti]